MAEPSSTIAVAPGTAADDVTGVRDLQRASDPTAPSALPLTAEMAGKPETVGRPDMASLGSGMERRTPRNRFARD